MTSQKPKKLVSIMIVLTMILTLLPATLGLAASYESIEQFVKNVYEVGLGREADEGGFNYWVKELEEGRPAAEFIGYVLLDAPEFKEKYEGISNDAFVKKAYEIVFNREADEAGLKFWKDEMSKGGSQKYVIVAMLYAPPGEFKEFCEDMGIKLGTIRIADSEKPGSIPAELKVVDVSAINLKEVVVEFNQAVDKTSAENKDAYSLVKGIGSVSIDAATLQADGKTVILTTTATLTNQATDYKLTIDKVKSLDGSKIVSKKDIDFRPLDVTLPTVVDVTALGNKAVKLTFSEPINFSSTVASTFKIDGVVVSGLYDMTGRTITLTLFNKMADGSHNITINNNVKDYANYELVEVTKDFYVVADTTAPTIAEVKDVTLEGATIVFSEDVKKAEAETASNYFWKQGSAEKAANSAKMIDGKTVVITFSAANRLPGYTTDLFVKNIVDYSGNKIADGSKIAVTATLDQTRPEVLTYKYDNDTRTMTLTFSKVIDSATFKAANVVVKNNDGKVVSNGYTASLTDGKILTITFTNKLAAGTYTFEFSGMKDTTLLENAMLPFSTSLEVKNTSNPNALSLTGTGSTYILTFDKEMDVSSSYSILNPANYYVTYVTTDGRTVSGLLPDATNLAPTNGNKGVILQFPNGVASITKLTVQGVKDVYGNFLTGYAKEFTTIAGNVTITKAEATGKNKVVLTMSQPMSGRIDKANFIITDSSAANPVTISKAEVDASDSTKVNLTLSTALSADAKNTNALVVYTGGTLANTTGLTGVALANITVGNGISVADKIAPTAKTGDPAKIKVTEGLKLTNNTTLTVVFDENIKAVNPTIYASNFKVYKADGIQLEYGIDYTVAIAANSSDAVITLTPNSSALASYVGELIVKFDNSNKNIIDYSTAKNVAVGFDTEADEATIPYTEEVAPTVKSIVKTDANKITVVFSETVDEATAETVGNYTYKHNGSTSEALISAELQADGVTVILTTTTAVTAGTSTLDISAIEDLNGNVMTTVSGQVIVAQ